MTLWKRSTPPKKPPAAVEPTTTAAAAAEGRNVQERPDGTVRGTWTPTLPPPPDAVPVRAASSLVLLVFFYPGNGPDETRLSRTRSQYLMFTNKTIIVLFIFLHRW